MIAYKTSSGDEKKEVWKFECKNLSKKNLTLNDIAPKLIWHAAQTTVDHFVIVSPSKISNDLTFLLENHSFSMSISVWTEEVLEKLIRQSSSALKRLELDLSPLTEPLLNVDEIHSYPPQLFTLDVVHRHDPPFSFDYIKEGNEILKTYTEHEFRVLICLTNVTTKPLLVTSLNVVTLAYEKVNSRILRLHKAKGIYQPLELTFIPSQTPGAKKNILGKNVWQVEGGYAESLELILSEKTVPGLYQLILSVTALVANKEVVRNSPKLLIHVKNIDDDMLTLQVMSRHHEKPVSAILNLTDETWDSLKRSKKRKNTFTFLGPTFHEVMYGYDHPNWTIRSCGVEPVNNDEVTSYVDPKRPSEMLVDLGLEVDEELSIGITGVANHLRELKEWHDTLPTQLKRKSKYRIEID